ncbi:MAG TPA: DUF4251 domain-containing protein [Bacteroidales bacterium]|nr:DUF4251 domain-containing protein [Bacteroidales bacterium]HNS45823.1 DUF4251 domain-containing protein [Bacteroidales bacterium]
MNRFLIIALSMLLACQGFGQADQISGQDSSKITSKESKKEARRKQEEWMKQVTRTMIENQRFVLEADYISGKSGVPIPVNPSINFIIIDSANATMQLGSATGAGWNGVGGVTISGSVSKYEVTRVEKKKYVAYNVLIIVFTNLGTYDIHCVVTDDGRADATIRSTTSGQVSYTGTLYPPEISRIYKGYERY